MPEDKYYLIAVGSSFTGSTTALAFLETCKTQNKPRKVLIVEGRRDGEKYGAAHRTSAYLGLDKHNNLNSVWINEMDSVNQGLHDKEYRVKT
jgi:hypothetical protein